jgi:hypothetical protein
MSAPNLDVGVAVGLKLQYAMAFQHREQGGQQACLAMASCSCASWVSMLWHCQSFGPFVFYDSRADPCKAHAQSWISSRRAARDLNGGIKC